MSPDPVLQRPPSRRRREVATPGTAAHRIPRSHARAAPASSMRVTWQDGSRTVSGIPVAQPLSKGPSESQVQAQAVKRQLERFDSMVRTRWNRSGWDDRGGDLTVTVNIKGMGGNAWFLTTPSGRGEMGVGVSDAAIGFRQSPAFSPSILLHEYVHGIVGTELLDMPAAVQPFLQQREHRAINESIADVISTGLLKTKWRNGQEIRKGAPLRDLSDPSLTSWNNSVRKDAGLQEHTLSGIISRAAVVAAETSGTMGVVDAWYAGIDRHYRRELLSVKTPFAGRALGAWVRATMKGAEDVGGKGSALVESMRAGWESVGLGRYAKESQLRRIRPPRTNATDTVKT